MGHEGLGDDGFAALVVFLYILMLIACIPIGFVDFYMAVNESLFYWWAFPIFFIWFLIKPDDFDLDLVDRNNGFPPMRTVTYMWVSPLDLVQKLTFHYTYLPWLVQYIMHALAEYTDFSF